MSDILHLMDYLEPINRYIISGDAGYKDGQIGNKIAAYEEEFPDLEEADIIIVGCNEIRGSWQLYAEANAPDTIRQQFYSLYYWHNDIKLADIGNITNGASLKDTYAALKTVISELNELGKTVLILG